MEQFTGTPLFTLADTLDSVGTTGTAFLTPQEREHLQEAALFMRKLAELTADSARGKVREPHYYGIEVKEPTNGTKG